MIYKPENAEIIFDQNGVTGRKLCKIGNNEFLILRFEINSQTQAHIQENAMVFYVQKGKATVFIDGEKFELAKGEMMDIKPGQSRQWNNSGNEDMELFVVKTIENK